MSATTLFLGAVIWFAVALVLGLVLAPYFSKRIGPRR